MDIKQLDEDKTQIQLVKQRFFAMRNGIVADVLRRGGSPYRIIFGLNLPQLKEIATVFGYDKELAEQLWANTSTRESRLMAPMLINPEEFTESDVLRWLGNLTGATEELDFLCHSLLRKLPFADTLVDLLTEDTNDLWRYTGLRLAFGKINTFPEKALRLAEAELCRNNPLTRQIAAQLRDEAEFIMC